MSKKIIWILVGVMTFAIMVLIVLQGYWLKSAYKVKEEHFDQQVTQSLSDICKRAEARETVVEISNEIFSLANNTHDLIGMDKFDYLSGDTLKAGVSISRESVIVNNKNNSTNTNTKITVVNGDSIIFNKIYPKRRSENINKVLNHSDISKEIVNKLNNKTLFVEKIINKLLNYNDNIAQRIDKQTLSEIIIAELKSHSIDLHFEFAVRDKNNVIVYSSSEYKQSDEENYRTQLFPNDFFSSPNYLEIYFPQKDNFIVNSLGYMGFSSILLTLIVMFSYTLTLVIIFKQKKLSEMKSDFVNNMTHELKTPISTISLASQMLKDKSIHDNLKNFESIASIIDDESKRLGYQVEKVLQMAMFERGNFKFKFQNIILTELISNVYNGIIIQVKKRGGTLDTSLETKNKSIEADEIHLTNVILNLLENALKYCEKEPEIKLKIKDYKSGIVISVKDNGIGISADDQKRIFEKFYRVHTGNVHNVKGFGLGLSYVKAIVDAHSGSIKVLSELGKGSEFLIYIPLKQL